MGSTQYVCMYKHLGTFLSSFFFYTFVGGENRRSKGGLKSTGDKKKTPTRVPSNCNTRVGDVFFSVCWEDPVDSKWDDDKNMKKI